MNEKESRDRIKKMWNTQFRYKPMNQAFSAMVRRWFIQGQADYRAGNSTPDEMNRTQANSWLMGWQCDAEVDKRGLQLAPLGLNSEILEEAA